jgi:hypothetical protein
MVGSRVTYHLLLYGHTHKSLGTADLQLGEIYLYSSKVFTAYCIQNYCGLLWNVHFAFTLDTVIYS